MKNHEWENEKILYLLKLREGSATLRKFPAKLREGSATPRKPLAKLREGSATPRKPLAKLREGSAHRGSLPQNSGKVPLTRGTFNPNLC